MNYKLTALIFFPIIFLAFLFLFQTRSTENMRSDDNQPKDESPFVSKLRVQDDFPMETLENDITELTTKTLQEGQGEKIVASGDRVRVNYRGWDAISGEIFDESFLRGDSGYLFIAGTGNVIEGWLQGTIGMKQGEVRRLYIPSDLAYGETGSGSIAPNADLIFDVELISFE